MSCANHPTFEIEALDPESELRVGLFVAYEREHTAVAGALRGVPNSMISRQLMEFAIQLIRARLDLLQADHICIPLSEPLQQALAQRCPQAINIPRHNFQVALPDIKKYGQISPSSPRLGGKMGRVSRKPFYGKLLQAQRKGQ